MPAAVKEVGTVDAPKCPVNAMNQRQKCQGEKESPIYEEVVACVGITNV